MSTQTDVASALAGLARVARSARSSGALYPAEVAQGLRRFAEAVKGASADTVGGGLERVVAPLIARVVAGQAANPDPDRLRREVAVVATKAAGVAAAVAAFDGARRGVGLDGACRRGIERAADYAPPAVLGDLLGVSLGRGRSGQEHEQPRGRGF